MRAFYFATALLVMVGIGAAYMLIPKSRELALMQLKNEVFGAAKESFEQQLSAGDMSASVVGPLADLYLQYGEVDKAVTLMERFVAENPNEVDARRRLGTYYQYAQRQDDYMSNLEVLNRLAPTAETLRNLSSLYNFKGEYEKQAKVLAELVARFDATPEEYLALARLQSSAGQIAAGARTLEALAMKSPQSMTDDVVELLLNLLLDSDRPDAAFDQAKAYLARTQDVALATRFGALFSFKRQPVLALRLLVQFEAIGDDDPEFLQQLVSLEAENGYAARALARLRPLYEAGHLPAQLRTTLVDLALQQEAYDLAFEVAERSDVARFPDWLLIGLVEAEMQQGRDELAEALVKRLGEDFLTRRPVLAARLASRRGDAAATQRWIKAAAADPELPLPQRLDLAALYGELGEIKNAVAVLRRLAREQKTPEAVMTDLANFYLKLDQAAEGADFFAKLRKTKPSPRVDAAWAVLAAAAGRGDAVSAWLDSDAARNLDLSLLTDIYFIANDNGVTDLALAAARRLYDSKPVLRNRLFLARALVDAGRAEEALPLLRGVVPAGGIEVERTYLAALTGALKAGAPVRADLVKFLEERVRNPDLPPKFREEIIFALLDAKAYGIVLPILRGLAVERPEKWSGVYVDAARRAGRESELGDFLELQLARKDLARETREDMLFGLLEIGGQERALPYLREFATLYGGDWLFAYEEALAKLGRKDELMTYLRARLADRSLPAETRRSLAFRMLDAGFKDEAEAAFLELAEDEPADGPAVQQLLYLWGPRPGPAELDWIEARARAAPRGRQRARWIEHLVNAGAAERALAIFDAMAAAGEMDRPTFKTYLDVLAATADRGRIAAVLKQKLADEEDPGRLRQYGRLASATGLTTQALFAYDALLRRKPEDVEALRGAGFAALTLGRSTEAFDDLELYHRLTKGDYESHYNYAIAARELGYEELAAFHYAKALEMIEAAPSRDYQMRLARAAILNALGRADEALAAFEALWAERPDDPNLRADFTNLLLENKLYDRAQQLLTAQ